MIAGVLTIGSTSVSVYDKILKKTYKCSFCGRPEESKGKTGVFTTLHFADGQHIELHMCKHCLKKYRPIIEPLFKNAKEGQFSSPYNITKEEFIEELFE